MSDRNTNTASSEFVVWMSTHVAIISLVMFCGVVGNGLVLIIYRRDKKQSGAIYIIALAVIDLFACVFLLPQIPLFELAMNYQVAHDVIRAEVWFQSLSTLFVQVTMAMDQFVAVFYPFKHAKLRGTLNKVMLIAFLAVTSTVTVPLALPQLNRPLLPVFVFVFLIGLLVLLTAYPTVALKLYKQRRSVGSHANRNVAREGQCETAAGPATEGAANRTAAHAKTAASKRVMHIQALKIYTSIFLVFLIANSTIIVATTLVSPWVAYGYYINHTVNPVIYYCFVPKFRNSVKEYWQRLPLRRFL